MFARYDLPTSIKVTRGCLGKSYRAHIADHRMRLSFPGWKQGDDGWQRPEGFMLVPPAVDLLPQSPRDRTRLGDGEWGRVTEWRIDPPRFSTAWLSSVMVEFEVRNELIARHEQSNGRWNPAGSDIDSLFEKVPEWFSLALIWIGAATDQDTLVENPIYRRKWGDGLSIRALADDGPSGTTWPHRAELISSHPTPLTLAMLRRIIAMTNAGRVPHDAHLFLRDARGELTRARFRRAVIDAATAVEIVLAKRHVENPSPSLNHPRPTLGVLVEDATVRLPPDTKLDLVDLRNDAIHRGITPNRQAAARALAIARQIVTRLEPLEGK